ncbi:MAG: hypothetical protein ACD_58C00132G0003 [uncultured bacterium]|nr:MAG: hypothetical protein ACD_58C00132G0003 [uncultured bacterium]
MNKFLIRQPHNNTVREFFAKEHKQFMLIFSITIIFGLGLTHWANATYNKNYNLAANNPEQGMGSVLGAYTNILDQTNKPADTLLFEGINLIKKDQTEIALLTLEEAVKRDPNYRDAALYTGYTYLRLAQEQTNIKTEKQKNSNSLSNSSDDSLSIRNSLAKAKEYLEKARDIDPLYAKTHEYLAVVYQLLGDTQNTDLSLKRAQDFAK